MEDKVTEHLWLPAVESVGALVAYFAMDFLLEGMLAKIILSVLSVLIADIWIWTKFSLHSRRHRIYAIGPTTVILGLVFAGRLVTQYEKEHPAPPRYHSITEIELKRTEKRLGDRFAADLEKKMDKLPERIKEKPRVFKESDFDFLVNGNPLVRIPEATVTVLPSSTPVITTADFKLYLRNNSSVPLKDYIVQVRMPNCRLSSTDETWRQGEIYESPDVGMMYLTITPAIPAGQITARSGMRFASLHAECGKNGPTVLYASVSPSPGVYFWRVAIYRLTR